MAELSGGDTIGNDRDGDSDKSILASQTDRDILKCIKEKVGTLLRDGFREKQASSGTTALPWQT